MNDVVLYTIGCPACQILEKRLDASGIEYRVVTEEKEFDELGIDKFPVLGVNGKLMNYPEANDWVTNNTNKE